MERRLHIIDSYALAFRSFYAFANSPLVNSKGEQTSLVYGYLNTLVRLVLEERATHVAIATDLPAPTFRTALYPLYKANRGEMPDEMKEQMPLFSELLERSGVPVLSREGMEADDVIAVLARESENRGWTNFILSKDKDLAQIVTERTFLFQLGSGKVPTSVVGPEEVRAKWGVGPELMRDLQALVGDSVDNVPGVPGVGPKTAASLLLKWGSLDELVAHVDEAGTPKVRQNLKENLANLELSKSLVSLRRDFSLDVDPETFDLRRDLKIDALLEFCAEHELNSVARNLGKIRRLWESETPRAGETGPDEGPEGPRASAAAPALLDEARELESEGDFAAFAEELRAAPFVAVEPVPGNAAAAAPDLLGETPAAAARTPAGDRHAPPSALWFALPSGAARRLALRTDAGVRGLPGPLREALGREGLEWIFHDAKSGLRALALAGIPLPANFHDAMLASWCLDAGAKVHELERIALSRIGEVLDPADRAARARAIAGCWPALKSDLEEQGLFANYRDVELPLVDVLRRMEDRGVSVDAAALAELSKELGRDIEAAQKSVWEQAGTEFNLASPKQLGEVLFGKLGLPRGKKTRTGEYSTKAAVLEELRWDWPVVEEVLKFRELSKLKGTYVDVLPSLVDPATGRVHTTFNQAGTATGRLSSSDPNLQNIPVRSELGARVRATIVPRDRSRLLVCADWSQIELRVLAHLCGDEELRRAYLEGADIHKRTAAILAGVPEEFVDDADRRRAKAINFGVIYGMSAFRLAKEQKISQAAAREFIENYFAAFPRVRAYSDEVVRRARADGYVTTLFGHRRSIPELNAENRNLQAQGERQALNSVIQGSAADLMKLAMVRVDRALAESGIEAEMLLQVHDELVFETPRESAQALGSLVKHEMESVAELSVPLVAEIGIGDDWKEAH